MSEHEWVVECVAQFLRSPLWTTPVHDFIDEHCILFSGTSDAGAGPLGEQSVEHTVIHNRFRELVDLLITEYIEELGVPAEDVLHACEATESADGAKFLEYMYALDKYETFVLLMARRNTELEAEALRQLNASVSRATVSDAGAAPSAADGIDEKPAMAAEGGQNDEESAADAEEADLKAAIAASLSESAGASAQREAALEDEELQRALQLSLAMEEQRKERELELVRLEEEEIAKKKAEAAALAIASATAAGALAAAPVVPAEVDEAKPKKTEMQVHEESAKRQETIKSTVHQARVENAERAVAPPAPVQKPAEAPMAGAAMSPMAGQSPQLPSGAKPAQQQQQHESAAPSLAPAALPSNNGQTQQTAAPAPVTEGAKQAAALPGLGSLRAGRSGATFGGFSKLPSIGTPAPAQPATFDELKSQAAQAKGETAPVPPAPESEEAIKLRAEHMRRQREKLMALKKQERQNELDKFRHENTADASSAAPVASPAKDETDAQHQDLTRALARRFRTDIASTAKQ